MQKLLSISTMNVSIGSKQIINQFSIDIEPGSIHILRGANGSGKSSLSYTIMGHPRYVVTSGSIYFEEQNITTLSVDQRAKLGIFFAPQMPPEIPGVTVFSFLKEAHVALTGTVFDVHEFKQILINYVNQLQWDESYLYRSLHEGFSGGEKKKLEALQLLLFKPKLAILDELDSGLDEQAQTIVMQAITMMRKENPQFSALIITHYEKTVELLKPNQVHSL